jgi:DNA-binding CsgD family transcriptional regulator
MSDRSTHYSGKYIEALKKLTPREVEVLERVSDGYTNSEIGDELYISKQTVQKHREKICRKLDLQGYRGLFHWCRQHVPG